MRVRLGRPAATGLCSFAYDSTGRRRNGHRQQTSWSWNKTRELCPLIVRINNSIISSIPFTRRPPQIENNNLTSMVLFCGTFNASSTLLVPQKSGSTWKFQFHKKVRPRLLDVYLTFTSTSTCKILDGTLTFFFTTFDVKFFCDVDVCCDVDDRILAVTFQSLFSIILGFH